MIAESPGRGGLEGFFLSGFLLALLGAVLPAWGYHHDPPDFTAVGNYFLSLAAGLVGATAYAPRLLAKHGLHRLLLIACGISTVALAYLAVVSPPLPSWWRVAGLAALGFGAGLLNVALFHGASRRYSDDAAGTVTRGGIWYGFGCLAATLLVAGAFYVPVWLILLLMAAVPAAFGAAYFQKPVAVAYAPPPPLRQAVADFRSVGAILFALLVFVQFGNEWSLAGWLPLLLLRRIGLTPKAALLMLALYWFFLMAGRLLAVAILPRVKHGRLLAASAISALFGCLILFSTNNGFGAVSGVVFLGAGYASIYPLVAEAIGRRFHYFHPGLFNGIFSLALLGGLLAPATLGYAAAAHGVGVVIGIPLIGTILVAALLMLIWLESKVTGR